MLGRKILKDGTPHLHHTAMAGKTLATITSFVSMALSKGVGQLVGLVLTAMGIMLIVLGYATLVALILLESSQIQERQNKKPL